MVWLYIVTNGVLERGGRAKRYVGAGENWKCALWVGRISMTQDLPDLFAIRPSAAPVEEGPGDEVVALVRARLMATLALVERAETMPWGDGLAIVREHNAFRFGKDLLPAAEGAALWAAFDAHMERLYAVMNAGLAAE